MLPGRRLRYLHDRKLEFMLVDKLEHHPLRPVAAGCDGAQRSGSGSAGAAQVHRRWRVAHALTRTRARVYYNY